MASRDDILKVFLSHELLQSKYQLKLEEMPNTVSEALHSDIPIVKTIALIVNAIHNTPAVTDSELRNTVNQYLNYNTSI